ncbi:MAG: FkbM family methyltransferase [Ruminococcus sp.]|nr:FkbM family methyltransferase [Ruminococcus sp.]
MIKDILSLESSWEKLQRTNKPIILYGTGNGADIIINELDLLGVKISQVAASEGFVRKRDFRGFTVRSISEIAQEYEDFIIIIGFATAIPEVMDYIKDLAQKHEVIMPVVPVFGDTIFNRAYLEANINELEAVGDLLYDEESKRVLENMVAFQFTGELPYLLSSESTRDKALTDILQLSNCEDMLDLGAYRGDTVEELIRLTGGYSSVTALEPDRKTYEKLCTYLADKENAQALPCAVWNEEMRLIFTGGGGRQSALSDTGRYEVEAVTVDSITKNKRITYVKMDVEGVEKEAIEGMGQLMRTQQPKLSIACYHRTEDLCTLIPLIHSINPQYKIHLRHHPYIPFWDTNLYCI